jgi:hypothetical protein
MNPESAIIIMFIASFVIGYITMPIMIGFNSPYIRNHLNKIMGAILMAFTMALIELFMHSSMLSKSKLISYGVIIISGIVISIYIIQKQLYVSEKDFLNGMIEHHAMGVKMAEKFQYNYSINTNPEITKLAGSIVSTQTSEIHLMDRILTQVD